MGSFQKYNKAAKYLHCINNSKNGKKSQTHYGKYQKYVVNKTRIIYLVMRVIYLVHDRLDLTIVWYTIV